MQLEACLPADLRGPTTTITPIAAGMSGAGIYRVDAGGAAYVLKVSAEPLDAWQRKRAILEHAAAAGVAPRVVHVEPEHRAVLSAFVVDRSFAARYGNPETRAAAVAELGATLGRVHALPLAPDADGPPPLLELLWAGPLARFALPPAIRDAVARVRAEPVPPGDRPDVLSHNDVNPTNVVHDGASVVLVDWDTASRNEPYYDLAAASVFFRMDVATCRALLAAHDGVAVDTVGDALPSRFAYDRRLVAVTSGSALLHLACQAGHPGATDAAAPSLADFYAQLRAGAIDPRSPEGQWRFGLALVAYSAELTG